MATVIKNDIGSTWTNIVVDLSLTAGQQYILSNVSIAYIYMFESTSTPAATTFGHGIEPGGAWSFTVESGMGIWIRTADLEEKTGLIAVTDFN